jgi:hypothetical protein
MDRLSNQTSIQALEIYKRVTENSDLDLSITFSGNVQVATKFDRAVNAIADHFRISSIEQRREQAKQVIRQKFDCEIKILAKNSKDPYQGEIKIGAFPTIASYFLPKFVKNYQKLSEIVRNWQKKSKP